jgi:cytoskeletal protein RodZ
MSRPTAFTIALAGLAVVGLSGCATDNEAAPASTSATTTASTSTAAPSSTSSPAPTSTNSSAVTSETATTTQTSTAATSTPMVGGMTECTKPALAEPATQAAEALGADNVYTVDELSCADGWAVTSGVLASKDNPEMGAPTSFIFEQEGQFWIPKDKAMVCGTNPTTTTAPADAEIPADLFVVGCAAG